MLKACIGLNCARTIDFIDHRHCSLTFIPDDVYRNELTLEELLLDCNMLQELPAVSGGIQGRMERGRFGYGGQRLLCR